jgi:hypothetical protein
VLFEMLAGSRPFEGRTPAEVIAHQLHDPLPQLREKRADLSPDLGALVDAMTAKDPARRPPSYRVLLDRIEDSRPGSLRDPALTSSPTFTEWPTARRPARRRAVLGWLAALAAGLGAGGVWWGTQRPPVSAGSGLAITPLYGPDEASAREGRLLAALVEAEIGRRRGDGLELRGADEAGTPVRTEAAARARARQFGVAAVVWGQVLALGPHVEAQPWITSARRSEPLSAVAIDSADGQGALERRRAAAGSLADAVLAAVDAEKPPGPDPPVPR